MQVEIKIDSSYPDPKLIILTASLTDDVNNIVKKLSEDVPQIISGCKDRFDSDLRKFRKGFCSYQ